MRIFYRNSWIISKLILALDYVLILVVEGSTKEYKEGEGLIKNTSDGERIKRSISSAEGRIKVILDCKEGKLKSPGGRVFEE